jgi:transposase
MDLLKLDIDIAKVKFNVCLPQAKGKLKHKVFPNNAAGFAQLQQMVGKAPSTAGARLPGSNRHLR